MLHGRDFRRFLSRPYPTPKVVMPCCRRSAIYCCERPGANGRLERFVGEASAEFALFQVHVL